MALPIAMPIGHIFEHLGTRIRFEANMGETLLFRDCRDLSVYMPYDEDAGRKIPPTEAWLHRELAAGRLPSPGSKPEGAADRQKRFAGLDRPACEARDPKLAMKERWVWAAREEDPVRTDAAFKEFISRRAADVQQKGEPLPTAASLRRWVRKKEIGENGASDLLNLAGRERGRSQLCSALDDIVHQSALYYWAAPNASIGDAESFMDGQWSQLTPEQLPDGASPGQEPGDAGDPRDEVRQGLGG